MRVIINNNDFVIEVCLGSFNRLNAQTRQVFEVIVENNAGESGSGRQRIRELEFKAIRNRRETK